MMSRDIKNKIAGEFQIFDGKNLRKVNYGDFVSWPRPKHFDLFNEILSAEAPVKIEREVQIGETDIIKVIRRIFMMIDNIVNKKIKKFKTLLWFY